MIQEIYELCLANEIHKSFSPCCSHAFYWRAVHTGHRYTHIHTQTRGLPHKSHPQASGSLASIYLCVNPLSFHIPPPPTVLHALCVLLLPSLPSKTADCYLIQAACYMISWNTARAIAMAFWVVLTMECRERWKDASTTLNLRCYLPQPLL